MAYWPGQGTNVLHNANTNALTGASSIVKDFSNSIVDIGGAAISVANVVNAIKGKPPIGTQPAAAPAAAPAASGSQQDIADKLYNLIPENLRASMVRSAREDAINITLSDAQQTAQDNKWYIVGGLAGIGGLTYLFMRK